MKFLKLALRDIQIVDPFLKAEAQCQEVELKDILILIGRAAFYTHLVLSFIYCTILLFAESIDQVRMSLILIIIYGFMLIWKGIVDTIFGILELQRVIQLFNKYVVKLLIIIYPVLALISLLLPNGISYTRAVLVYLVYHFIASILFIFYLIFDQTCSRCNKQKSDHSEEPVEEQNFRQVQT